MRRPAIPDTINPADIARWCKHTTDNISALNSRVPPFLELFDAVTNSVTNSVLTSVTWNAPTVIGDALSWTADYPTRITCKTAGLYTAAFEWDWINAAGGFREAQVRVNGVVVVSSLMLGGTYAYNTGSRTITLLVGDYVELVVQQTSAAPLGTAGQARFLQLLKVG